MVCSKTDKTKNNSHTYRNGKLLLILKKGKKKYKIHENGRGQGIGKWMSTLSYW